DLGWRRDVLRQRLPRAARIRLAATRSLEALSALIAVALIGLGAVSYLSATRWLSSMGGINVPQSLYLLIPFTLAAAVGCGLTAARSTRRVGMLLIAGAALVTPWLALNVLGTTSSFVGGTVSSFRVLDPEGWQLAAATAGILLCVLVLLAVVSRRPARPTRFGRTTP
ncbi:MAG: hypothetical protein QM598_00130, partial [Protaetiibacter sp.]